MRCHTILGLGVPLVGVAANGAAINDVLALERHAGLVSLDRTVCNVSGGLACLHHPQDEARAVRLALA